MKKGDKGKTVFGLIVILMFLSSIFSGVVAATTYDPQAAVNYADTWWNGRNPNYHDYSSEGGDCANFASQCLIAGGLDLSGHPGADSWGCIPSCTNLHDYLVNYLGATYETRAKSQVEPIWFVPGDPAIFPTPKHAVFAVTCDATPYATCNAHSTDRNHKTIQRFFDNSNWNSCTYYHIPTDIPTSPALPTITSPGSSSGPGPTIDTLTPTVQWNSVSNSNADKYLYDMGIATGKSVGYYEPYQTQLDSELHNIEAPNQPLTAIIDSITPDPAEQGTDTVSFYGHGTDTDGTVEAYNWSSSIDGPLSTSAAFTKPAYELSVGTHTIYFKVQDNDGTWSTKDTADLTIYPGPELSYSPESHEFGDMCEGETDNTTFEIWNSGTDTLTYSLSETCDWLEVNPTNGSSTGAHNTITVDINTTGLSECAHTCDIKINSNDGSGTFTVMVNVVPCPCGNKGVNPTSWSTTLNCGESDSQIVTVSASDCIVNGVTVSKVSGPTWLSVSQTDLGDIASGSSETFTVTAAPPAGTRSGDYPYTIRVSNNCGTPSSRDVAGRINVNENADGQTDYWAVIVGVADYTGTSHDLAYADDDAIDMYDTLLLSGDYWQPDHIVLLLDSEADKAGILTAFNWLDDNEDPDDEVLFFFSGHGTYKADDDGDEPDGWDEYICPYDFNDIRDDELDAELDRLGSTSIVVIIDSCFAGGMTKAPDRSVKTLLKQKVELTDGFAKDIQSTGKDMGDAGRVVLMACDDDEYSYEIYELENGLFSYYVIEGLEGSADAEGNGDNICSAEETFVYAEPRVVDYISTQNPQLYDEYPGELPITRLPCPDLSYSPASHNFGDKCEGETDSTTFELWNSGTDTLTYSLSETCDWLEVNPTSGSSTGEHDTITVDIDTTGLSEGSHTCDITINSNDGTGAFTVTVTVVPCPELSYSPASHDFGDMCEGNTDSTTFEIWNSRTGTLTYSLSESCGWAEVNPTSGSSTGEHDTITVDIDTMGLSEGFHTCDITISSNGGSETFTITVNVVPCPCGNMSANPTSWSPTVSCSESNNEIVTVSASGGMIRGVTVSKVSGPTWLSVSPTNLGDIASGSSKTFTMTAAPPSETSGDFGYTIRVSNTCGTPSTRDVSGTIHVDCIEPNQPPSYSNPSVSPGSGTPSTQFDYSVDVSDPNGDTVTVTLKTYDPSDGSWEDQGNRNVVGSGTASWNDLTPFEVDDKGQTAKYTFVFDDGYNSGEWGPFNGPAIEIDAGFSNWDYPSISMPTEKIPVEVDISNPHGVKSAWLHYDYGDDGSEDGVTQMSLISVRGAKTEIRGGSSSGLGVKAQKIAVSGSAPLSGGGGSGVAEREGIQKSIYLYDAKTCKDVEDSDPYDPIGVTTVFSPTDSASYTWLLFNDIWSSHTVKWEWYAPNGNFYTDCTYMIPDPSDSGQDHWDWYNCWCGIYINGYAAAEEEGIWTVKVYLDGGHIETLYFNIEYIISDYTMCKNVQDSSPYDPIERTSTFLADDEMAVSWLRLDDVTNSLNVRWDWYDPSGNPYYTWDIDTSDPADEGYDYWDWTKAWCYIPIKDYAAAGKPGEWVVKVYICGEYIFEEEFTIYPDDARYKCEIPAPGMDYAGDEVSFYVSAYSAYDSATDSAKHLLDIYVPDDPTLSISPSSHDFGDKCEGETDSTTFELWNSGTGTLTYSLSETCSWVEVNPTSGSSTGEHDTITVDIDTTDLSEGSYICNISISSNGGNGTFTVTVNIISSTGSISVSSSPSGAKIYLDNKYEGKTPHTITEVPPGYHTIKLSLECYHDWTKRIQVTAGETTHVHATLTPLPICPDLVITGKWVCWPDNCTIYYNVANIGNGTAPAGHNTTLYVDDVAVAHDHVPVDLAPGESYIGCFGGYTWTYTPPSDDITVCADNNETIDELDEDNNCLTNIWMCGDVTGDGRVRTSDGRRIFRHITFGDPIDNLWAADVTGDGRVRTSDGRRIFRHLTYGDPLNCKCSG